MNSTSSAGTRKKLLAVLDKNNTCKAYWGYIIPRKSNKSGCTLWEKKNKKREVIHKHPRLYNIWGTELYKLVTGKEESLKLLNDKLDKFLDSSSKVKTCKDKVEKKIKAATKEIYSSTEFKNLFSLTFEEDS